MDLEEPLAEADAAGNFVIDEDGRAAGEGRLGLGVDAEIARIAHQVERRDVAEDVGQPGDCAGELLAVDLPGQLVRHRHPVGRGVHLLLRDVDLAPAEIFVGVQTNLLELRHQRRDQHLAVRLRQGRSALGELLDDIDTDR